MEFLSPEEHDAKTIEALKRADEDLSEAYRHAPPNLMGTINQIRFKLEELIRQLKQGRPTWPKQEEEK